ncbi:MAG: response regulator [Lachnospiraceae bacterium]|jgi:two-component system chemotaxis response regulator CheY|nr:response regulator [Lachnospiraceae bacterium]MCR5406367.1 response regulator [Lachnospiraceae bacterium]
MSESNVKMLVCDDSILARKSMTAMLNSFGYENVFEVSNGEDAVNKYKAEKPDIVFLDIVMPVKDGITATKEIIEFDPDAKIIVISSVGTQTHLREVIKAGAKDFIQKPVDQDLLKKIIEHNLP